MYTVITFISYEHASYTHGDVVSAARRRPAAGGRVMSGDEENTRALRAHDDASGVDSDEATPYVVVRNGDDADLTVSVSVAGESGPPVGGRYSLAGERARAVSLDGSLGDVLRIEVDAEVGASAQVSLDPASIDGAEGPIPEFVVRDGRIVVSGLTAPFESSSESLSEHELS